MYEIVFFKLNEEGKEHKNSISLPFLIKFVLQEHIKHQIIFDDLQGMCVLEQLF